MIPASLPTRIDGAELAVETRALFKCFPGGGGLNGLDLQVPEGAVYVLAGPNGAGKSTTLKILLDLVRADAGEARVTGLDPARKPAWARAQVGYVPETSETAYGWLRAGEFLRHHAAFYEAWDWRCADALCKRLVVPLEARMRELSKGAARALLLVAALAHRPPVLLLDEPSDGLDPLAREELGGLLVEHMGESPTTILWCTHHVHEVDRLADHVGVIRDGRLVVQAPREVVRGGLRRYRAQVPEWWTGSVAMNGEVLLRERTAREIAWTVWGDEDEVTARLAASGATVRDVAPLSLEEATLALLRAGRAS